MMCKNAIVTGGAKGIGEAIVKKLISENYFVYVLDLSEKDGQLLEKNSGGMVKYIYTDISDYDSVLNASEIIKTQVEFIDALVVNAGISYKNKISDISAEQWDKVINVNLNGSFYTIKAFENFFNKKEDMHRSIVMITSGSAITGTGGGAHYAATKSGQHGLMRAIAKEWGPNGVNINAVAPRVIDTELLRYLYNTESSLEELKLQIPMRRLGTVEDVANLTTHLLDPKSSYVHGQIILCDGGRTY